jgi:protocatechuate 3,4-dioxygenase beta subunit
MTRSYLFRPPRFFLSVTAPVLIVLSGLAPIGAAQQPDAITGRVLGNDGNPLVNAKVSADKAGARGPDRIYRRTTTDDEGYFQLTRLPPGEYLISASAEGYLSTTASATERHDQPNDRYFRPGASVTITLKKGGVITGRVTDAEDRAVVAVLVSLEYVREADDRPRDPPDIAREEWTDDRGVYRFYGLQPGSYLVRAGGRGRQDRWASAFDSDAPTYYPSAPRENATEVRVGAGEEARGIDIRYRGERGHAIRGVVGGAADFNRRPYINLNRPSGAQVGFTYSRVEDQSLKFDFEGLPDGEYELIAGRTVSDEDDGGASAPRRLTIKGADVNGIELRLIQFASLSGRFILAADSADCQIQQRKRLTDASTILYKDDATKRGYMPDRPDQQGAFTIRGLEAGRYRLAASLPHIEWYLRAITQTGPAPANRPVDVSRQGLTLQPGERKTGLVVTVAEGAAFLSGNVSLSNEGAGLPTRLHVYLVPAESASADDALRYVETEVESNGRFTMRHLAPGRYYLLARPASDAGSSETQPRPAALNAENRAKLWREARRAKVEIELQACQRVTGYVLRYEPR